jgi:hypothetical protein
MDPLKGINRARDSFRELRERWDNRLVLKRGAYAEDYCRGRIALLVYCKVSFPPDPEPVGILRVVRPHRENISVLILKADVRELHYLEHWDEQLMLVRDVHIVQGPQGAVPSRVGFYDIDHEVSQCDSAPIVGKFLLFQSAIYGTYKFVPLIADWKMSMEISLPSKFIEDSVVQQIKRTSEVVQGVSDDKSGVGSREVSEECNADTSSALLLLDANGVKVRRGKFGQQLIQVIDVLHGPFNLFP